MVPAPSDAPVPAPERTVMHAPCVADGIAKVVAAIADSRIAAVRDFLPPEALAALRTEALRRDAAGQLARAGIGRGGARTERADIRGDRILWLEAGFPAPCEMPWIAALEALAAALNRDLMLGLWSYEGHYALYPPGASYARHRDRFADDTAAGGERIVSCILYLNPDWSAGDGGALRIHLDDGGHRDVFPEEGTLVAFLAAQFEHEVLPATRPRLAVSGWLRGRPRMPV